MKMLNFEILKNPLNWLIVLTMVLASCFMVEAVRRVMTKSPAKIEE